MSVSFINDSNSKFLNPVNNFDQVVLLDVPNSTELDFFRYILECITGITSGSDFLNIQDYRKNNEVKFKGDGITDKRVWIIKSHYPYIKNTEFKVSKAILLIKNPLASIQNFFLQKLKEREEKSPYKIEKSESYYDQILQKESDNLKKFFNFWINAPIPLHILRYEDLASDFVGTMKNLFAFLFSSDSIKETILESKIITYFKFNKNMTSFLENIELESKNLLHVFTIQQKNLLLKILKNELVSFGYLNENDFDKFTKEKKMLEEKDVMRLVMYVNFDSSNESWFKKSNEKSQRECLQSFLDRNREDEDEGKGIERRILKLGVE